MGAERSCVHEFGGVGPAWGGTACAESSAHPCLVTSAPGLQAGEEGVELRGGMEQGADGGK